MNMKRFAQLLFVLCIVVACQKESNTSIGGNDDNSKMGNLTGGTVPALIWKDVMKVATEPYGNNDFDYPAVDLKAFKAKIAPVIISPESAQKTFEKEESAIEAETQKVVSEETNESEIEDVVVPMKQQHEQSSKIKNEIKKVTAPKVEVKPIKIETPQAEEQTQEQPKLAPIPMAKPF